MTATLPEPTVTRVPCILCRAEFNIRHEDLRALVEHGGQPHCGCKPQPVKAARAKPVRPVPQVRKAHTKAELILLAVRSHEEAHGRAPSVSAIVVSAWHVTPEAFGLARYETQYPDSNRVIMELVKMKGQGLLSQPAEKHYQLTDAGLKVANLLLAPGAA